MYIYMYIMKYIYFIQTFLDGIGPRCTKTFRSVFGLQLHGGKVDCFSVRGQ